MNEKTGTLKAIDEEAITEDQVISYLRRDADFFVRNEELLAGLRLPHQRGGTVSLVERQMELLRKRLRGTQGQLHDLIGVARDNEQLFSRTRRLTLGLLEADSLESLAELVQDRFRADFATDVASLILISEKESDDNLRRLPAASLHADLKDIGRLGKARAGKFEPELLNSLFPLDPDNIASALVCPVPRPGTASEETPLALLALGSFAADYFHADLDTTFLDYVRDVLARRLDALLPVTDHGN